jgi:PIN domain nuclease of toxin-antitoxin system
MIAAVADTHSVLWHLAADPRLSAGARAFIEAAAERGDRIGISAITFAEVVYLVEKKRIPEGWSDRLFAVVQNARNVFVEVPLTSGIISILSQVPRVAVPDLPDRLIAATALSLQVPVITRDRRIQASGLDTVW